jgi:hypothetical protein
MSPSVQSVAYLPSIHTSIFRYSIRDRIGSAFILVDTRPDRNNFWSLMFHPCAFSRGPIVKHKMLTI